MALKLQTKGNINIAVIYVTLGMGFKYGSADPCNNLSNNI